MSSSDGLSRRNGQANDELTELRAVVARLEVTVAALTSRSGGGSGASSSPTTSLNQSVTSGGGGGDAPVRMKKRWICLRSIPLLFLICIASYFSWITVNRSSTRIHSGKTTLTSAAAAAAAAAVTVRGGGKSSISDSSDSSSGSGVGSCDPLAPLSLRDLPPVPATYTGERSGKSLFITVVTADHINVFIENFPSQERHLLQPWDSHFMLAVPLNDADAVIAAVTTGVLKWEKVMDFTKPQRTYPCEGSVDMVDYPDAGWYRTPAQVTVLLVVRKFRLPAFVENASFEDLSKPCGILKCCNGDGSGTTLSVEEVEMSRQFSLLNIAFVHHLLVDEPLVDHYDYVFKLDADINFHNDPPISPGALMRQKGCVIMQSEIMEVGSHLHCVQPLVKTMQRYADHHKLQVRSAKHGWCEQMNLYMVRQ